MNNKGRLFSFALGLNALATSAALIVYGYMGIFSRYLADDYCHHELIRNHGFIQAVKIHFLTFSNRYMILVVPWITERFGVKGQSWLPAVTLLIWLAALYGLFREIFRAAKLHENAALMFLLAAQLAFWTILQAPNRYQSIYWEASSINRFVPLALTTILAATALNATRQNAKSSLFWKSLLFFVVTFFIGGFDEMNDALIFAASFLLFASASFFKTMPRRRADQWISGSIFLGSLFSMGVMMLSPGIGARVKRPPTFPVFIERILEYPIDFLIDTLRTLPLPSLLAFLVSAALFFLFAQKAQREIPRRALQIAALAAPLILYALLIVNFAPSAYAQSYPARRALLGARALTSALFMLEGGLLGWTLARRKTPLWTANLAMLFLALFSLYPLRAARQTIKTIPYYRQRAAAWDARDAAIRAAAARGETNLLVPEFDSLHGIKELDENPKHWVNRCAARYYGVESIQGVP